MLKVRIIPTLLWKDLGLVKGKSFDSWRRVGTVLPAVKVYCARQVDELILVDITASNIGEGPKFDEISEMSQECFVPLTVGGGVKSVEDVENLLRAGADKVAINSASYSNRELISSAAKKFGSQCVVASIDFKTIDGKPVCFSHSGKRIEEVSPVEWARTVEAQGAGEILLTSIERDGTMVGYDIETTQSVTSSVGIPVIISGGAGNFEHMYEGISKGGADAVAAASIFHFTEQTPLESKKYLAEKGVPVRNCNAFGISK